MCLWPCSGVALGLQSCIVSMVAESIKNISPLSVGILKGLSITGGGGGGGGGRIVCVHVATNISHCKMHNYFSSSTGLE